MSFWDKIKSLFKKNDVDDVTVDSDVPVEPIEEVTVEPIGEVTVESLAGEQEVIDKLYAREGLSDRVLEMQVALNQKRNKYDISDKKNLNKDGWSQ